MIDKQQKHPFLRGRTSYFEVSEDENNEGGETRVFVRELIWREFKTLSNHPQATCFYGRDPFYDVFVVTIVNVKKSVLRDIATDIYQGKYVRRNVNLRRV